MEETPFIILYETGECIVKMQVSYISDLHLDFWTGWVPNQPKWEQRTREFVRKLIDTDGGDKEVVCICGDTSHFNKQSLWAIETFSQEYEQVIVQYGNHDIYLISNSQSSKYKNHSQHRLNEYYMMLADIPNVHPLFTDKTFTYKGITFGGNPLWYPLETFEQQTFFNTISNDSKLIKGFNIAEEHHKNQKEYEVLLSQHIDVMVSHFPVINIDSHFKFNSTACYLTPVKDIQAKHWVFGHSHEQKVYEKPYCTFYMNAIGYPEERNELSIKNFNILD